MLISSTQQGDAQIEHTQIVHSYQIATRSITIFHPHPAVRVVRWISLLDENDHVNQVHQSRIDGDYNSRARPLRKAAWRNRMTIPRAVRIRVAKLK